MSKTLRELFLGESMNTVTSTKNKKSQNVLFQKLGNTWYIFSEHNNEVIYSAMPEGMDPRSTKLELYEVIEEHMENLRKRSNKNEIGAA